MIFGKNMLWSFSTDQMSILIELVFASPPIFKGKQTKNYTFWKKYLYNNINRWLIDCKFS